MGSHTNAQDWGSFGSYIAGAITLPFSIGSLYFLYQTYKTTEQNLYIANFQNQCDQAHSAIKEAASFIETSLNEIIELDNEKITFREAHNDLSKFEKLTVLIKSDNIYRHRYMVSVGKPMLCLYDFLAEAHNLLGSTLTSRFYKIRYQWLMQLHNDYNLEVIHADKYGISSEQILDFFYATNET